MTPRNDAPTTSSSMEEVAAKRPEEVRAPALKTKPHEAHPKQKRASPPQSSLRADSSSIEEERGAWVKRRAKEMRADMTPHEKAMWSLLRQGELVALNWRKQSSFGGYFLDFVSHPARLVVEVDGSQHATADNVEHDAKRTAMLEQEGYLVLRFWNNEAARERDGVWGAIYAAAEKTPAVKRMKRWREKHMAEVRDQNAMLISSIDGERN